MLLLFSGSTGPAIYLMVTVLLLIFSSASSLWGARVPNPGGFYAFITARPRPARRPGYAALLCRVRLHGGSGSSVRPSFGVTLKAFLEPTFGFPVIEWYWYGLVMVGITTAFAYRRIDLSAKFLTIVMGLEIVAVVIFDVAAFLHGGPADGGRGLVSLSGSD